MMGAEHVRAIEVALRPPYTVHVGVGIAATLLPSLVREHDVALISDTNVMAAHGSAVAAALRSAGKQLRVVVVPPGERSKSIEQFSSLHRDLAATALPRDGAVVALGGGVVGDLAGFVAATYSRGVAFYQVPTSLLAMVDASVGGKTGLDLPEGKNLVGAFWQPRAVVADVTTLSSLPDREFRQGTVEAFKHSLLAAPDLLDEFWSDWGPSAPAERLVDLVTRSIAVKAEVVAADEREAGRRMHLNLGHTLAHALESATSHALAHGDAVGYGLLYSVLLSRARGHADLLAPVLRLLDWLAPAPLPSVPFETLRGFMGRDKKVAGGRLRLVLLEDVGRPVVVQDATDAELESAWRELEELL